MSTVSSTTPLWIAARQLIEANSKEFFTRWAQVAKKFDVEDIHDLRVASRRLREGLALFEPCFAPKRLARLGKQMKQVTGILGELRNTDESILFFSKLKPEEREPSELELRELLDHLGLERLAARQRLEDDMKELRPAPLKSGLKRELDAPQLFGNKRTDPFQELSRFADGALQERALPLSELLPQALDQANAVGQHQMRIAVKKMRYRLEILEPLFSSGFPEMHGSLKGYQEVLGKLHDLDVFAGMVLDRVPEGAGQQNLLRSITARRSRLYASFVKMQEKSPIDAIGAQARSSL
jgi:CHAD domain-containing protein